MTVLTDLNANTTLSHLSSFCVTPKVNCYFFEQEITIDVV